MPVVLARNGSIGKREPGVATDDSVYRSTSIFDGQVLIVFLAVAVINTGARAQDGLAMRPCDPQPRIEVGMPGIGENTALGTISPASRKIEWDRAIGNFVEHVEERVAQSGIDGQVWSDFILVLDIAVELGLAQPLQRKQRGVGGGVQVIREEIRERQIGQRAARRIALVHIDASNLDAELDDVARLHPGHVVDIGEGGSETVGGGVRGQRAEIRYGNREWNRRDVRGVINILVDAEFGFIDQGRRENVEQLHHAVLELGIGVGQNVERAAGNAIDRFVGAVAQERGGAIGEMLIEAQHAGVLVIHLVGARDIIPNLRIGRGRCAARVGGINGIERRSGGLGLSKKSWTGD